MSVDFPHPIPSGWFAVMSSAELATGEVRPIEYFGRPLVLFRTQSGRAQVLDAYCPHLGAHLGVGGRVVEESIQCPFHGWRFDTAGRCVEVSYAKRIPESARIREYPTVERNGFILMWFDEGGGLPTFELPELEELASPDWVESFRQTWRVGTQIQEMGENGVDSAHFPAVHGSAGLPDSEVTVDGPRRKATQYTHLETSKGRASSVIEVHSIGMGFGFTRFSGICDTVSMNLMTPIDGENTEFTVVFLQRADGAGKGVARAICADLEKQVNEDIPIWENKAYHPKPILCDGDGPIVEYRRWCSQFYPTNP